jgi:hypothetical protein
MRLSACRFKMPLTDNSGRPIKARVLIDLHRKLLAEFQGFTIHPTSKGRWQSRAGRLFQEEVVEYEVAIPEVKTAILRSVVCRLGEQLGQHAMYFDAPAPSVEIIELRSSPQSTTAEGGSDDTSKPDKTARRRGKKNRPPG